MPPEPSYPGYGYRIVAPGSLLPAVEALAAWKESQGLRVDRVSLEEILEEGPGRDDPEKLRNALIGFSALTPEREFVLLVGSMSTTPMRVAYPDPFDHGASASVPTDFYYEDLTGEWDADGDGFHGEYGDDMSQASEDYRAELCVGRIPWDDPGQVQAICERIVDYEQGSGPEAARAMTAGATIETACDSAIALNAAESLILGPAGYEVVSLYEECPRARPDLALTGEDFVRQWETWGPTFVFMLSHGSPYGAGSREQGTYFIDVDHLPRGASPAVAVSSGCSVGSPDSSFPSLGRVLLSEGVCASFLGASRITWYGADPSPVLLGAYVSATTLVTERRALGEAKLAFIESYAGIERAPVNLSGPRFHQNLFLHMLYGDPSLQLR
ncbi:MAG: C25 family cysteine peptidase [bacterium]